MRRRNTPWTHTPLDRRPQAGTGRGVYAPYFLYRCMRPEVPWQRPGVCVCVCVRVAFYFASHYLLLSGGGFAFRGLEGQDPGESRPTDRTCGETRAAWEERPGHTVK